MPDPVDYRSPAAEQPRPKRSAGAWMLLVSIWIIGVVIWGIYLALGVLLLVKFL